MMNNPLKAFLDIRKGERLFSLAMFAYFFLVITSFWILKPIKKSLFIRYYDQTGFQLLDWRMTASQAELLAKVLNIAAALAAVFAFTWLARRLRRSGLAHAFGAFFLGCFVLFSMALGSPTAATVWSFYLFGDLYSTVMVAVFFAFLNDSVAPASARRLYGLIGLGGVLGGVFGSSVVRVYIKTMGAPDWQWVCFGLGILVMGAAALAGRHIPGGSRVPAGSGSGNDGDNAGRAKAEADSDADGAPRGSLLEGARMTLRSPYLLSMAAMVGLYEIISTLMDFQFTASVEHYVDGEDIGRHFATVYSLTNWLSMGVQFFLTSMVMSRLGVGAALLVLPLAVMGGSGAFLAIPALWMGSALSISDNALNYSINQSARESLYTVTGREGKYQAKAFIDMFLQRFAKALAVGVSLLVTALFTDFSAIRWLSLVSLVLVAFWILAARHAGKRFAALSAAGTQVTGDGTPGPGGAPRKQRIADARKEA